MAEPRRIGNDEPGNRNVRRIGSPHRWTQLKTGKKCRYQPNQWPISPISGAWAPCDGSSQPPFLARPPYLPLLTRGPEWSGQEPMTASGTWPSSPRGAIAVRPTAFPLPWQAPAFRRPVAARSPVESVPAATFPSEYPSAHRSRAGVAGSSATRAVAAGVGLLPATGAAASGRPDGADRPNGGRPGERRDPYVVLCR
jgi:hypothetical protein